MEPSMTKAAGNQFIRLIKYFLVGFAIGFVLIFLPVFMFYEARLAMLVGTIFGSLYGLFVAGFMIRTLRFEELEIIPAKLGENKSLDWYYNTVIGHLEDMRYSRQNDEINIIYKPRTLYRVFEPDVIIQKDAYSLKITASRMMIRMLSDLIEPSL
jgi:hypothetical protein